MGDAELAIEQVAKAGIKVDLDQDWHRQHRDNQLLIENLLALKPEQEHQRPQQRDNRDLFISHPERLA